MKKLIYFVILCLSLNHCSTDKQDQNSIRIELSKEHAELKYESFLTSVTTIKLKTEKNAFLPDPRKCNFSYSPENIFIYSQPNKKVYIFDYEGNLRSVIDNSGKGPMEYIHATQLLCNAQGELIIIDSGRKAIFFDQSFEPCREINFENRYNSILRQGETFYAIRLSPEESTKASIIKMDRDFNIKKEIPVDSICPNVKSHGIIRLLKSKQGLIFQPYPIIKLYKLSEDFQLQYFMELDLGENAVNEDDDMINDIQLLNTKSWLMRAGFVGDYLFVLGAEKGPKAKAINFTTRESFNISRSRYNGLYSIRGEDGEQSFDLVGSAGDNKAIGIIAPEEGSNDNFSLQIGELKTQ